MSKTEAIRQMLLEHLGQGDEAPKSPVRPKPIQARVLLDILPDVLAINPYKVGDLVEQRPNTIMYNWPADGHLAIVTHLITDAPRNGKRFERDDMVILCNVDDKWLEFSVESWRFRKYEGAVE